VEHIHAPYTIQPERIFGLIQHYSHDFMAEETCGFVRIDKEEILKLSDNYFIFKLNLLNLLSREVQVCAREPWKSVPKNLEERIVRFIGQRCIRPAGRKEIFIKMTRLAEELNDSRLDVSIALNHLQDKGLIQLSRGKITVPAMEDLLK
jgi:CRP-like cAMP-binding protein